MYMENSETTISQLNDKVKDFIIDGCVFIFLKPVKNIFTNDLLFGVKDHVSRVKFQFHNLQWQCWCD